jgi:hypothetical protein
VLAVDALALLDALGIARATVARVRLGIASRRDHGGPPARTLHGPRRGDRLPDRERRDQPAPAPPEAELGWWYLFYFATERGRLGYRLHTRDFARLIWRIASPRWTFDDRFAGPYQHRVLDGTGHNVPQEAPSAFADAVLELVTTTHTRS